MSLTVMLKIVNAVLRPRPPRGQYQGHKIRPRGTSRPRHGLEHYITGRPYIRLLRTGSNSRMTSRRKFKFIGNVARGTLTGNRRFCARRSPVVQDHGSTRIKWLIGYLANTLRKNNVVHKLLADMQNNNDTTLDQRSKIKVTRYKKINHKIHYK